MEFTAANSASDRDKRFPLAACSPIAQAFTVQLLTSLSGSSNIARLLGAGAYGAKLYSREPMDELPELDDIQSALTSRNLRWTGTDIRSRLNTLYLAAWRILDLMAAPKDVFLQVFSRNDRQLPKLPAASHRPTYEQRLGRGWCLGIRLCVERDNDKQCARPYVDLASGTFAIDGLCVIRGLPPTHRGALDLTFSVEASLHTPDMVVPEPPIALDGVRESRVQGTLQQHNDAIREGILLTINGRTFATPTDLLEAASTAVESVFRSSQLSKCLSLRGSNVVLQSESRARVAVHKTYPEIGSSAHCLKICTAKAKLVSNAEHRVEATQIEIAIHHWHPDTSNLYTQVAADLSAVIARFFKSSSLCGIAAIEATCRISMTDGVATDLQIEQIDVIARLPSRPTSPNVDAAEGSLDARATFISEIVSATLEQISGSVNFENVTTVPKLLAESVLKVVSELMPGLEITTLSMRTSNAQNTDSIVVVALPREQRASSPPSFTLLHDHNNDRIRESMSFPITSLGTPGEDTKTACTVVEPREQHPITEHAVSTSALQYFIRDCPAILEKIGCATITYTVTAPKDIPLSEIAFASPQDLIDRIEAIEVGTLSTLSSVCLGLCRETDTPSLQSTSLRKLFPMGARINLRCQAFPTIDDGVGMNARDEFWKLMLSVRSGLQSAFDCCVFDDIQASADTVALWLVDNARHTASVSWSEVRVTTAIYEEESWTIKPISEASAMHKPASPGQTGDPASYAPAGRDGDALSMFTESAPPSTSRDRNRARMAENQQATLAVSPSNLARSTSPVTHFGGSSTASSSADWSSSRTKAVHDERFGAERVTPVPVIRSTLATVSERNDRSLHNDRGNVVGDVIEGSLNVVTTTAARAAKASWRRGIVIALGSNMGDRIGEIEKACRAIDADPDMRIVDTSCLYESEPMYVEDQDRFINGVCEIETTLSPMDLLDRLQAIERGHGRVKLIDKGPRNIDLDILLYGDKVMSTERLIIPHALMQERAFVLKPLLDLRTVANLRVPKILNTPHNLLDKIDKTALMMESVTPLVSDWMFIHRTKADRRTHVMSILNTTPDSFSDGGAHESTNVAHIKAVAAAHIAAGATIIDVGGQSSRPDAPDVTAEEEMSRVLPTIAAIRSLPQAADIAISVDTYRAAVAEAAVNAGAHIVNDISAGTLDPLMLKTVARLGCTYVMMHMRGTPATMSSPEHCTYMDGLLTGVRAELQDRIDAAIAAGVRKWRIIIDPGIGFAKTSEQNVELLRLLSYRQMQGLNTAEYNCGLGSRLKRYPMLLGSSRKGFIGTVTGVKEPKDRVMGTAATVTAAVIAGADIVRVHDVAEMAQVVKMADAIYRSPQQAAGRKGKVVAASALRSRPRQSPWRSQRKDGRRSVGHPSFTPRPGLPFAQHYG
ncbi:hypothetical protein B0A48_09248 [Cryoendolithus antarcticus]|uniref:Folic acid synthesis protein FOL1 n=1 Tax=Cryoendolithus antarcticus TaxID=1507870 RepID=A0A1V8T2E5_9PEZI|nr:hypothetical protein B0A48_09248 [Cryoendolithus antarcticus]